MPSMTLDEIEFKAKAAAAEVVKGYQGKEDKKELFADRDANIDDAIKNADHKSVAGKKIIGEYFKALALDDQKSIVSILKETGTFNESNVVVKDLADSTDANGGYLTPLQFSGMLIEKKYKTPVIRAHATVMPMSSDKMEVPVEGTAPSVNWTAELATITQSDPTFTEIILAVNMLIGISRMSRQVLIDAAVQYSLSDWVMGRIAAALGRGEDTAFMAGTGSGQPKGIRQYTFTQTATQAGANLTGDDIISTYYGLPVYYRDNAVWIINDKILKGIRKLKDTSGRYMWSDNFQTGMLIQPGIFPTLLDRPVIIQNDIPTNLGGGTNASEIYFGDLSYYIIGQREQVFSESSTVEGTSFAQHRVAVKVGQRLDGQLSTTDAFSQLTAVIP